MVFQQLRWITTNTPNTMRRKEEDREQRYAKKAANSPPPSTGHPGTGEFIFDPRSAGGEASCPKVSAGMKRKTSHAVDTTSGTSAIKRARKSSKQSPYKVDCDPVDHTTPSSPPHQATCHSRTTLREPAPAATVTSPHRLDHTYTSLGDATRAAAPHPGRPDAASLSEHLSVAYPACLGEPSYSAAGYSSHNAHEYLFESITRSSAQSTGQAFTRTYSTMNSPSSYPPASWSQQFATSNQSPAYPSYLDSETDDIANRLLHPSWQGASTLSAITPKIKSLAGIEEMRTQGTTALLSCNNSASCPNAPAFSQRISSLEHLTEDAAVLRSLLDATPPSAAGSSTYSGGDAPSATFDSRERRGSLSSGSYSPGFSPFSSGEVSTAPTTPESAVYAPASVPSYSLSSNVFAPAYNFNQTSGSASSPAIELLLARETLQQAWGFGVANDLVLGRVRVVADDFNALGLQYGRSGSGAEPSPTELAAEWIRKPIERPGDSEREDMGLVAKNLGLFEEFFRLVMKNFEGEVELRACLVHPYFSVGKASAYGDEFAMLEVGVSILHEEVLSWGSFRGGFDDWSWIGEERRDGVGDRDTERPRSTYGVGGRGGT
ncbi:hypothetical protein FKP32DRAFT_1753893 [Trametes sanguinea]|nr:hypothetical protein FKP32DRAFT_1753893 [Trametes sanguinea]